MSNGTIGQGKNEYLTANDPVIGSYMTPMRLWDIIRINFVYKLYW